MKDPHISSRLVYFKSTLNLLSDYVRLATLLIQFHSHNPSQREKLYMVMSVCLLTWRTLRWYSLRYRLFSDRNSLEKVPVGKLHPRVHSAKKKKSR